MSWRSKWVVSDRQQDPPNLALCSSRVKVRIEVPWHLPDRMSCTKVIPYLAFACELECVYHDVLKWSWVQVSFCHTARLGYFFKNNSQKKCSWSYSFISMSLSTSLPKLTLTLPHQPWWRMWSLIGRVGRHLLDSNLVTPWNFWISGCD